MNTEVVMKRRLFDGKISQKGKNGYFSATDSVNIGNIWRLQNRLPLFSLRSWLQTKSTEQFIDLALAIDSKLKIEVYKWLYDELLKYRNGFGDSRLMALCQYCHLKYDIEQHRKNK